MDYTKINLQDEVWDKIKKGNLMFFNVFIFLFLNESTMTYHKNIEVCKQLSCSITDV